VKQAGRWAGVHGKKEAEGARWVEKSGWLACGMGFSAKLFNYFKSFFSVSTPISKLISIQTNST
jgi:hypothetical protein